MCKGRRNSLSLFSSVCNLMDGINLHRIVLDWRGLHLMAPSRTDQARTRCLPCLSTFFCDVDFTGDFIPRPLSCCILSLDQMIQSSRLLLILVIFSKRWTRHRHVSRRKDRPWCSRGAKRWNPLMLVRRYELRDEPDALSSAGHCRMAPAQG